MRISIVFLAICGLFLSGNPSSAQQSTRGSTEPGQIEKRIERQPEKPAETTPIGPATLKGTARRAVEAEPVKRFVLSAVNVSGGTIYPVSAFSPLYEEFLGKEVSNTEIEVILKRITGKYVDDGYFLAVATAPPQDLSFGIISIRVTEGYIGRVVYKGDKPGRPGLFDEWAARITDSVPARLPDIERYILLMSDISGLNATPSLDEASSGEGVYEMTINLTHKTLDLSSSLDNRGTHPVGPLQWSLSGGINSILGGLERTRFSVFAVPDNPEELLYGEIYSQIPLNSEGTHFWVSASRSKVDIYSETRGSELNSGGDRLAAGIWHPFIRQQEFSIYVNSRFDHFTSRQSALDDNFEDRLRVVRGGFRVWYKDPIGGTTATAIEYSRGLDIMNATSFGQSVSRTRGESEFDKYTVDLNRVQKLTADFWGELNGRVQYSDHTLLSSEEFGVGGTRFGRGYDPSEISDSRGAAASIELRHRIPVKDGLLSKVWIYGFYDIGAVWRSNGRRDSLASAGGGVRAFPFDGILASLEVAKPLTYTVFEEQSNRPRIFFSLSASF